MNIPKYVTIDNFVDDLNYTGIIIHIGETVDKAHLKTALEKSEVNHMSRFDQVWESKLFYIDNCDLQTVDSTLEEELKDIEEDRGECCVLNLTEREKNSFVVQVPNPIRWSIQGFCNSKYGSKFEFPENHQLPVGSTYVNVSKIIDTMDGDQKTCLYYLVGLALDCGQSTKE